MKILRYLLCCILPVVAEAQQARVAAGQLVHISNFASKYIRPRNIDVWLPPGYNRSQKYAVIYMHDGQMLFDSTTTWNKQEWRVDETLSSLMGRHAVRSCIVVAIWNTEDRFAEYFPQKAYATLPQATKDSLSKIMKKAPDSDDYLHFIVSELKPHIDSAYSTLKDRAYTFIMGSSMGGLISMYAICEYPKVFGGAACLSTHWPGLFAANQEIPDAFNRYMQQHLPSPATHKLYFDHGDQTLDALYAPYQKMIDQTVSAKGYTVKSFRSAAFPGADHSERSWAKRLNVPLLFLLNN